MAGRQRGGPPPPAHVTEDHRRRRNSPSQLEDRIASQHREIQTLLLDNQRLLANHVALKKDLAISDEEIRDLLASARNIRQARESEVKELYERSMKLESEVRAIDGLHGELGQVREDIRRLTKSNIELSAKLKAIDDELGRFGHDVSELPAIRADFQSMQQELQKGRAAIEFEKKTHLANLQHKRTMERNVMTMESEIERLRAELANAEERARAVAAGAAAANPGFGYVGNYGSPNLAFGGGSYPPVQYATHQVQNNAQGTPPAPYGPTGDSHRHVP